jgi:diacylglycerol kinase
MKLIQSFGHALNGLRTSVAEQLNLRIHLFAVAVVVFFGFYFSISNLAWCMLISTASLVISLELVNTALENLTDLVTQEKKPLAGKVKDIAAGAVLVAALASVLIGIIIFTPYVIHNS